MIHTLENQDIIVMKIKKVIQKISLLMMMNMKKKKNVKEKRKKESLRPKEKVKDKEEEKKKEKELKDKENYHVRESLKNMLIYSVMKVVMKNQNLNPNLKIMMKKMLQ